MRLEVSEVLMFRIARQIRHLPIYLLIIVGLVACNSSGTNSDSSAPAVSAATPLSALTLRYVDDCVSYKQYLADALLEDVQNTPYFNPMPLAKSTTTAAPGVLTAQAGVDTQASGSPTYVSQTNTQEQGVDEADIVEAGANGTLYQLRYGVLHILVI